MPVRETNHDKADANFENARNSRSGDYQVLGLGEAGMSRCNRQSSFFELRGYWERRQTKADEVG